MRHLFCLILLFFFSFPVAGKWQYSITNYSKKEYKAANQNWQITQHPNGWMYIANNKGLLEFDGVYWNSYLFDHAKVRAVHIHNNRIYAGGLEQFGYYTPDEKGNLVYTNLSKQLPSTKIGVIWNIYSQNEGIYFVSDHAIYLWNNNALSVVNDDLRIISSGMIDNALHILAANGLMKLANGAFHLLPNSSSLAQMKIIEMLPSKQGILLVSDTKGLYFYNNGTITQYEGNATEAINSNKFFCAAIKGAQLALGSVQDGILLIHLDTDDFEYISIENGLQNKTVLKLYFDFENNLWVGLDNGIDCVHLNSPLQSLCKSRIIGSGYSASYRDGFLYLGTNQGLYCAEAKTLSKKEELDIHLIKGTEGQVWSLRDIDGATFCNSDNGVFLLNNKKAEKVYEGNAWDLIYVNQEKNALVGGGYSGLFVLCQENGKWKYSHKIAGFGQSCKTMIAEDMQNTIWIANSEQGIHRLKLSEDLRKVEDIKNYNTDALPVKGNICIAKIDNALVFTSIYGLFRYNHIRDSVEQYQELEELLDGRTHYTYIAQDDKRNIWYVANGTLKLIRYNPKEKSYERNIYESYLTNSLIDEFEDIYFHSDNQLLIGTEDGFSLLNTNHQHNSQQPVNLCIRKVYNTSWQDSLIYGRSFTAHQPNILLPYSHNSLRVEFAATSYDPLQDVMYAWRLLEDEKGEWSDYSHQTYRDFTHLQEGSYTFEVRALTNSGLQPNTTLFAFEILPPWYRSFWAYICYFILVLLLVYTAWHRVQESRKFLILKQEQEMLQKELEFKKENELKDKKIDLLREENLKAELKHKTAELINSTLNLTRKNEMLLEIKKEAISMGNAIKEENLVDIRRKNLRLINKIDTNLEQDKAINDFQTNFDALHHGFFSALEKQFPNLNKKEKMLCAYIRTNMISKEIAPLLNLSVRGVEITRYRLRKKLNLNEKDNLYEFLQRITSE
ncbi:transcriptional regulator [Bacteroides sp. 519]|uniref:ligand-binding sensor domain-containing protein n=1 Tax=Bacteroides sp. 519 TaxID=2302937 RepID=UPI0013D50ADC|nr:transcriptional regulator [Bacteroides sp. 519]NDV57377.1 transcriptional regulator [Bacteroides sp. 519]